VTIAGNSESFVASSKRKFLSLAEVTRMTISAVERGRFDHSTSLALKIANVLKSPV